MAIQTYGRQAGTGGHSGNNFLSTGRVELTTISTALATNNQHNQSARCDHCQRRAPRLVRYVERLDGGNSDACRACFLRLTANEKHAALVERWHGLFHRLRPRFNRAGGAGMGAAYA